MTINSIPNEILCDIFHIIRRDALAHDKRDMSWVQLCRVSKRWRVVLQGDPFMWTRLYFRPHTQLTTVNEILRRLGTLRGMELGLDAGRALSPRSWLRTLCQQRDQIRLDLRDKVHVMQLRWHVSVRDQVFDVVEAMRADGVRALTLEEYDEDHLAGASIHEAENSMLGVSSICVSHESAVPYQDAPEPQAEPSSQLGSESGSAYEGSATDNDEGTNESDVETSSMATDFGSGRVQVPANSETGSSESGGSDSETSSVLIPDLASWPEDSSTYVDSSSEAENDPNSEAEDQENGKPLDFGDNSDNAEGQRTLSTNFEEHSEAPDPYFADKDHYDYLFRGLRTLNDEPDPLRELQLPDLPQLQSLWTSGILVAIPSGLRKRLVHIGFLHTVSYHHHFARRRKVQSWLLDNLHGCASLESLRLHYTIPIDSVRPYQRRISLPRLKHLVMEDYYDFIDEMAPFFDIPSASVKFRAILESFVEWARYRRASVFRNFFPADMGKSVTTLDLRVDSVFTLRGGTGTAGQQLEACQALAGVCDTSGLSNVQRGVLAHYAIQELPYLLRPASNIIELRIHIAPVPEHYQWDINWAALDHAFPNVRQLTLGSDRVVKSFFAAVTDLAWPNLREASFCLSLGEFSLPKAQFVPLLHRLANVLTVRPYLRVTIRLQTGGEPVERSYLGVCLLHLARHPPVHGRVQLVTDRCETCGLPELLIGA